MEISGKPFGDCDASRTGLARSLSNVVISLSARERTRRILELLLVIPQLNKYAQYKKYKRYLVIEIKILTAFALLAFAHTSLSAHHEADEGLTPEKRQTDAVMTITNVDPGDDASTIIAKGKISFSPEPLD